MAFGSPPMGPRSALAVLLHGDVPALYAALFIRWLTEPGDVVYDPFSGRGTTALEACLLQRIGLGSDANPMAWTLTAAKSNPPSRDRLKQRIDELRRRMRARSISHVPGKIRYCFTPRRCHSWCPSRIECLYCEAMIDSSTPCSWEFCTRTSRRWHPERLTVAMPNTFAMAPNYVRKYIGRHRLKAPEVDVLAAVQARIEDLDIPSAELRRGSAWLQDVRSPIEWPKERHKASLIFASPPYLQVMKYGKMNWIRLWLLGHEPADVDNDLFTSRFA